MAESFIELAIKQKFNVSQVTAINDIMFEFIDNAGQTITVLVFGNLITANLFATVRHPNLLLVGDISFLDHEIFVCPINRPVGVLKDYIDSGIDYSRIPIENKIKWAWQILQFLFQLRSRGYNFSLNTSNVWVDGFLESLNTNIIIYDFDPAMPELDEYAENTGVIELMEFRELMLSLFGSGFAFPTTEALDSVISMNYPRRDDVVEFLDWILNDEQLHERTYENLPIFNGLQPIPAQDLPIVQVNEVPDIEFLPKIVEAVAVEDLSMKALFAAVDLWYRCGSLTLDPNHKKHLAYAVVAIASLFSYNPMLSGTNSMRVLGINNIPDFLIYRKMIAEKLKFTFYRSYLYEPAWSLSQLIMSYVHIIPYYQIYTKVDIKAWYNSLKRDLKSKRALVRVVLNID